MLWIESAAERNTDNKLTPSEEEELKHSPDFIDKTDYEKRLKYYESSYQPMDEEEGLIYVLCISLLYPYEA